MNPPATSTENISASASSFPRVHVVGVKNSGKTTLVLDLVRELTGRGLRVGTIKHTHHSHVLDTPGKDSDRHRQAGGSPASVVSGKLVGVYLPIETKDEAYAQMAPLYAACDLVVVEGDLESDAPKIEVWRSLNGSQPYAHGRADIAAIVTDDALETTLPTWARADVAALGDRVLALAGID